VAVQDLDAGDLPEHGRIAGHLQLQDGQRDLEVGREPGFVSISAREEVVLGHVALILADIHVVELGLVAGLDLDLLGDFAASVDAVALMSAEDGPEAALFCLEAALQGLDHFSVGGRVPEEHVERGLIGCAGSGEASLPAP